MNLKDKDDYISYRLQKAIDSYKDAKLLAQNDRWNASVNRLYYSCFYAIIALLYKNDIKTQTHDGVRTQFGLKFVKTGKIEKKYGKLYSKLFDYRLKGDYGDFFDFDQELVDPLFKPVEELLNILKSIING